MIRLCACGRDARTMRGMYCCYRCYERAEQAADPAHTKECDDAYAEHQRATARNPIPTPESSE